MVLVWRRASHDGEEADGSEDSLSDTSEEGEGTFCYVLHVNEVDANPDGGQDREDPARPPTPAEEEAIPGNGASPDPAEAAEDPPSERTPLAADRAPAEETSVPEGDAKHGTANQLPKAQRRHRPVGQSSLDNLGAMPPRPHRRLGQVRRSRADPPSHIRQRYTAGDLDRISKCVDGLNLHIQQRKLSRRERDTPSTLPPSVSSALRPLSPHVTRSAPPSPKEKHLQVYDEVDTGTGCFSH